MSIQEIAEFWGEEVPDNRIRRKISHYVTYVLIKLNFTGNQVSALGLFLGMFSCVFFATGSILLFAIGSLILFFGQLMDYCDGSVVRYRKVKGLPDELFRNRGGGFDSLNHVAPMFALISMSIGFTEHVGMWILFVGFLAGAFEFTRSGLRNVVELMLKLMGIKFVVGKYKKPKYDALFPCMMYNALILFFVSIVDMIFGTEFIVWVFILLTILIFIEAIPKTIVLFPRLVK